MTAVCKYEPAALCAAALTRTKRKNNLGGMVKNVLSTRRNVRMPIEIIAPRARLAGLAYDCMVRRLGNRHREN